MFKKLESQGLITNLNRLRKNLPSKLPKKVFVWDETLREGEQALTVFLTYVEKVKLAKMMDEIGIAIITVGFPAVSKEEKLAVRRLSNEEFQQASIAAPARILRSDIDACLECGIKEIPIFTQFNGLNLRYRLKMTKEQVLEKTVDCIEYTKKHGVIVDFVLEDASRTPIKDILRIFEAAVKAGTDRLVIADTVGFLRPLSMRYLVSHVRSGLVKAVGRKVPLSVHCHNDFGLATANALAAIEEGVSYPHTCIAGFGRRAGAAPLEEVVTALELLYRIDTGINLKKLHRLSQLAEKCFATPIPFHKPIVGENAFSHGSEAHAHSMLTQSLLDEPFPPKVVGRESQFYLGKQIEKPLVKDLLTLTGIKASSQQIEEIVRRMRRRQEKLDKGEVQMIFYQIKKLTREMQKGLTEEDFWKVVKKVTGQKPKL